jgi:hypothetical protein
MTPSSDGASLVSLVRDQKGRPAPVWSRCGLATVLATRGADGGAVRKAQAEAPVVRDPSRPLAETPHPPDDARRSG